MGGGDQRPSFRQGTLHQRQALRGWRLSEVLDRDGRALLLGQELRDAAGLAADENDALPSRAHLLASLQNPLELPAVALAIAKQPGERAGFGVLLAGRPGENNQPARLQGLQRLLPPFPAVIGRGDGGKVGGQFAGLDQVCLEGLGLAVQVRYVCRQRSPVVHDAQPACRQIVQQRGRVRVEQGQVELDATERGTPVPVLPGLAGTPFAPAGGRGSNPAAWLAPRPHVGAQPGPTGAAPHWPAPGQSARSCAESAA